MRNLVSICKEWYYQKSPFWLQEILIFMLMTARTRMLQNSKIYCLNLDYNNMWMCQLTEMDTRSIFSSPTRMSDNTILDEPVASYYISHHTFVVCQLNTQKPATVMETIKYRKYKQIDIEKFKNDIEQSCLYTMTESTCNEDTCDMEMMAAQYNTTLRKVMEKTCPGEDEYCEKETSYALVQRWNQRSQTWQTEGSGCSTVVAAQRWPHKKCNIQRRI